MIAKGGQIAVMAIIPKCAKSSPLLGAGFISFLLELIFCNLIIHRPFFDL